MLPIKIWADDVEEEARKQLENVASLPWVFHHVAAMADCHWGVGATVGSVIAMKEAVSPAAVGVDIGCFVGETKVPLLNGTQKTLKFLAELKEPFWVYSVNKDMKIVPGLATCKRTRRDAELVRVTISGGEEIICTPDHQFMMSDGSYRNAKDLSFNKSLMPLYRAWQKRDGYESVHCGNRNSVQTHVMAWEMLNGVVPKGHVIHHRDHNHLNNDPSNLDLMTSSEHSAHHRRMGRKFKNNDPEFQALRLAGIQRSKSNKKIQEKRILVGTKNITKFMNEKPELFRLAVKDNGKRGAPYLEKFNTSPRTCGDCNGESKNPAALRWHKNVEHGYNHKVVSVEALTDRADVYCLTVDEHHNFALAAGVFVHNCGMGAVKTSLRAEDLPESLKEIRHEFERSVPVGHQGHKVPAFERTGFLKEECESLLSEKGNLSKVSDKLADRSVHQLGTLGGGNHFIELSLDTEGAVWVMLHSGSRNIGKVLAEHHITEAKKLAHNVDLPAPDLAVFMAGTPEMKAYRHDLFWAQRYAMLNRKLMMSLLLRGLQDFFPEEKVRPTKEVWCHHNYVSEETHFGEEVFVTRKGAISANLGELGIIPGSMGTRSYIVSGLGNPDSYNSASHGAGRRMSRGKARKTFTLEDFAKQTAGVECRKDVDVLDEIPGAYKDIDVVMKNQKDLVKIEHELKAVLCVKG